MDEADPDAPHSQHGTQTEGQDPAEEKRQREDALLTALYHAHHQLAELKMQHRQRIETMQVAERKLSSRVQSMEAKAAQTEKEGAKSLAKQQALYTAAQVRGIRGRVPRLKQLTALCGQALCLVAEPCRAKNGRSCWEDILLEGSYGIGMSWQ